MVLIKQTTEFDKCLIKTVAPHSLSTPKIGKIGIQIPKSNDAKQLKETIDEEEQEEDIKEETKPEHQPEEETEKPIENIISTEEPSSENVVTSDVVNIEEEEVKQIQDLESSTQQPDDVTNEPNLILDKVSVDDIPSLSNSKDDLLLGMDMDLEVVEPELNITDSDNPIQIKNPNQVYHELYRKAKDKARKLKKEALIAIMEANSIKSTYMLDGEDSSDLSDMSDYDDEEEVEHVD